MNPEIDNESEQVELTYWDIKTIITCIRHYEDCFDEDRMLKLKNKLSVAGAKIFDANR